MFFQRHSIHGITEEIDVVKPHQEIGHLSAAEKQYLLAVERGDVTTVHKYVHLVFIIFYNRNSHSEIDILKNDHNFQLFNAKQSG